jgi:tRNA modification GTPase
LLLILHDASHPNSSYILDANLPNNLPTLQVWNKADLLLNKPHASSEDAVWVSAKTGEGLDQLKDAVLNKVGLSHTPDHGFMARQRHVDALNVCGEHLEMARLYAQQDDRILDLFAEELRLAHDALGEITGRMLPDDLLGLIFSRFCIGK